MGSAGADRTDGRQARWRQHNEDRRRRIVEAAIAEIAAAEPGADVHVQTIAERADLSRSVVYRHFNDRVDLDAAVQEAILEGLWADLLPAVSLEGTIPQIIERIISIYVGWAAGNPSLHAFAQTDLPGQGISPLEKGIVRIGDQVTGLIDTAIDLLDLKVDVRVRASLDPLVFGLVGMVFSAVRRWLAKPTPALTAPVLVTVLSDSVWAMFVDHASVYGVPLDPEQSVEELLGLMAETAGGV